MILSAWIPILVAFLNVEHGLCSTSQLRLDPYDLLTNKILQQAEGMKQKSIQARTSKSCVFSCTTTDWCLSINFKTTPPHLCELLSSDRFINGTSIKEDGSYLHYSKTRKVSLNCLFKLSVDKPNRSSK